MSDIWRPCPDGGACHHGCLHGSCFRVHHCGPLSGVYPDNRWPAEVVDATEDPVAPGFLDDERGHEKMIPISDAALEDVAPIQDFLQRAVRDELTDEEREGLRRAAYEREFCPTCGQEMGEE